MSEQHVSAEIPFAPEIVGADVEMRRDFNLGGSWWHDLPQWSINDAMHIWQSDSEDKAGASWLEIREVAGWLVKGKSGQLGKNLRWKRPRLKEDKDRAEIKRAAGELQDYSVRIRPKRLRRIFKKGYKDDLPDAIWRKLINNDSFKFENGKIRDIIKYSRDKGKKFRDVLSEFIFDQVRCPIVLCLPKDRYFLVNGGTRLMICRSFGIRPRCWFGEADAKDFKSHSVGTITAVTPANEIPTVTDRKCETCSKDIPAQPPTDPVRIVIDTPNRAPVQAITQKIFGRALSSREYGDLIGAQANDKIVITPVTSGALTLTITGAGVVNFLGERLVGRGFVQNTKFMLPVGRLGEGEGGDRLITQIQRAPALGITQIRVMGIGPINDKKPSGGYYHFPLIGFDGIIGAGVPILPDSFYGVTSVLDLYARPGGRQWWRDNGNTIPLIFDLTAGSRSQNVFQQFAKMRGEDAVGDQDLGYNRDTFTPQHAIANTGPEEHSERADFEPRDVALLERLWDKRSLANQSA
jgi:hypothetical protein